MSSAYLGPMAQRMDRVERENRRLKSAGLAVLVAGAALLLLGQAADDQTTAARQFVIADRHGNARGSLGLNDVGAPALRLLDSNGKLRMDLSLLGEEPSLSLHDADGRPRIGMGLSVEQHVPLIELDDAEGNARVQISMAGPGPCIALYGDDGAVIFEAP